MLEEENFVALRGRGGGHEDREKDSQQSDRRRQPVNALQGLHIQYPSWFLLLGYFMVMFSSSIQG